ncbi:MAG: SlyX protein [Hyphomicrobiaceae bacterium]|jgi:SlyX protein
MTAITDQDPSEKIEERFQVLETKVVYQERTIDDLNSVVTRQQDQIDLLIGQIRELEASFREHGGDAVEEGEEPPPPHY